MKRILSTGLTLAVALCAAGVAVAHDDMSGMKMGGMSQTVKIAAQNDSGESGTATLSQTADGLVVKVALTGATGDQPAHIHKGSCSNLDPKPAYPLTTLSNGASTTTLKDVKLSDLTAGMYAINVHKSTTDLKDYVACGDLTAGGK